jgi:hypothetical protein
MKEEDEESEGLKKIEQIMKHYIWLHYDEKWSLNLLKLWKDKEFLICWNPNYVCFDIIFEEIFLSNVNLNKLIEI